MGGYQFGSIQVGDDTRDLEKVGEKGRDRRRPTPRSHHHERERFEELEKENRELRRANEILKAAAAFFGAKLDRKQKR